MTLGVMPPKPHTVFRAPDGAIVYEEMITRHGFDGEHGYFYHRFPTTASADVKASSRGFGVAVADEEARHPLRRKLYLSDQIPAGGQALDARTPLLTNKDLTIWFTCPTESDDAFFANGDGDELWYVQSGDAVLESICGRLTVTAGDYVHVPRSLIHRWEITSPLRALVFEAHGGTHVPKQFRNPVGQLRMDAPYTHRDFKRPVGPIATFDHLPAGPRTLVVKKGGRYSEYELERCPLDVVGWEGCVYPWAFPIRAFQPKIGQIHLPPTIHGTFAGQGFLVCSFVPRVTDFHPDAIPCPYPHSSVDCDEMILYLEGNFTSRKGVGPGAISLHPAGIAHGPHPGAYERSIGTKSADELAVMIDSYLPLLPATAARAIEHTAYHESWKTT